MNEDTMNNNEEATLSPEQTEQEKRGAQAEQPKQRKKKSRSPKKKADKQAELIKELENKLKEAEDKNLRLRAEYDNYRKRSYRELSDARVFAKTDAVAPFLNVLDHFKMAVDATDTTDDVKVLVEGLKMINAEFAKAMEELGVTEIDAVGKPFDPEIHEAVAEEASEAEEGTVIKQWRCGYKMGDKLLRPASVVVSSGAGESEE